MKPFTGTKLSWPLLLTVVVVAAALLSFAQESDNDDDNDDDDNDDDAGMMASSRQSLYPKLGWRDCGKAPGRKIKRKRGSSRIIGGSDAYLGEFPSYVLLVTWRERNPERVNICGGVLISDQHVLTALHCIAGFGEGNRRITKIVIGDIHFRDHYDRTVMYDIAGGYRMCNGEGHDPRRPVESGHDWLVLELAKTIQFNNYTQPACLPRSKDFVKTRGRKANCFLVGLGIANWTNMEGDNRDGKEIMPKILQKLAVEEVDCFPPIGGIEKNDPSRICYVRAGKQTGPTGCDGDSGGPVICMDDAGRQTVTAIHAANFGNYCNADKIFDGNVIPNLYTDIKRVLPDMDRYCEAKEVPARPPRVPRPPPYIKPPHEEFSELELE